MNGEITLTLNASADFTRKGYGAHVEAIGGSFDRITKADTTRGVTLPLTSAGMAMATQLVDRFCPANGRVVCHGHIHGSSLKHVADVARGEGADIGSVVVEAAWRFGKAEGCAEREADAYRTPRGPAYPIMGCPAPEREADDWRTVALALARQQA